MNKLYLVLFFLLFSCSTSVTIDSRFCKGDGIWTKLDDVKNAKKITKRVVGYGEENLRLYKIFNDNKVSCKDVKELSVQIRRGFLDSVISAFPGFSSSTVDIYYR